MTIRLPVGLSGALFAASVTISASAYAAEPQIVIAADTNPKITETKVIDAARKVCVAALKNDAFGDFGTLGECIANSVDGAYYRAGSYRSAETLRSQRAN